MGRPTTRDVHVDAPMSGSPQRVSKPWTVDSPPPPAKNWTPEQKRRCVSAGNKILADGGTEQEAIFACIRAAGKSTMKGKQYKVNDRYVTIGEMAQAWLEKQSQEELKEQQQVRAGKYGIKARDDGSLTIPGRFKKLGASEGDFADPVNFKFPVWLTVSPDAITDEQLGMVRNAPVRFSQFASNYDEKSRAKVQARIEQARKKFKIGEHKKTEKADVEWQVDVIKADGEKRLVYGVVLRPDTVDAQKDVADAEAIEGAAHSFMVKAGRLDVNHQQIVPPQVATPVESYIAPVDFEMNNHQVTKGSWVLVTKIFNDELWQQVKSGEFGAYSIKGRGKREPVQ